MSYAEFGSWKAKAKNGRIMQNALGFPSFLNLTVLYLRAKEIEQR